MVAPSVLSQVRVPAASHPDGALVAGAAVVLALLLAGLSPYRRLRNPPAPGYRAAAVRTVLVSLVAAVVVLGSAWLSGLPVEALLATPGSLGLPPASPVLVAGALPVGLVLFATSYGLQIISEALGLDHREAYRRYALAAVPSGAGRWAVHLLVVLPVQVVGYELLFRAAVLGGGVAGGLPGPWLYLGSIGLFAAAYAWTGVRNTTVMAFVGAVLGLCFLLGGLVLAALASYVLEVLNALASERYRRASDTLAEPGSSVAR